MEEAARQFVGLGEPDGVPVADRRDSSRRTIIRCVQPYCGSAGRIGNCRVGVLLSYAGDRDRAWKDRARYWSNERADDMERREAAKVPFAGITEEMKYLAATAACAWGWSSRVCTLC
jgi:hypothetical protein